MTDTIRTAVRRLHDEYAEAVNAAVAESRDDLVADLVARYTDDELHLVAELERAHPTAA